MDCIIQSTQLLSRIFPESVMMGYGDMRAFAVLMALVSGMAVAGPACAAVTININSTGTRVIANAFGTLDLTGLTKLLGTFSGVGGRIAPSQGQIAFNTAGTGPFFGYNGIAGSAFGTGGNRFASSTSGTPFSVSNATGNLFVQTGFASGGAVRARNIWENASLASLGMTAGTYEFTLPNDRVTFNIGGGTVVPEPASWAMMIAGFGLVGAAMRRRFGKAMPA